MNSYEKGKIDIQDEICASFLTNDNVHSALRPDFRVIGDQSGGDLLLEGVIQWRSGFTVITECPMISIALVKTAKNNDN